MRLSSKRDVEFLVQAVKGKVELKETVQCAVPRLRKPRIIIYDLPSDVKAADVVASATEQANFESRSITVKFSIKCKELTHWVLEITPDAFHKLRGLKRLVIPWSRSKIAQNTFAGGSAIDAVDTATSVSRATIKKCL